MESFAGFYFLLTVKDGIISYLFSVFNDILIVSRFHICVLFASQNHGFLPVDPLLFCAHK